MRVSVNYEDLMDFIKSTGLSVEISKDYFGIIDLTITGYQNSGDIFMLSLTPEV